MEHRTLFYFRVNGWHGTGRLTWCKRAMRPPRGGPHRVIAFKLLSVLVSSYQSWDLHVAGLLQNVAVKRMYLTVYLVGVPTCDIL